MNQQDKSFLTSFVMIMSVLVLIAAAIFLVSRLVALIAVAPGEGTRVAAIEERIRPVASVLVASPAEPGAEREPRPAQEVVTAVCAACHTAGVLGAPKIGGKDEWGPRFDQGLDTLVTHAVSGIKAMPPKGGDPTLTEEEIREAIVYMLSESGIDAGAAPATAEAPAGKAAAAPAPAPAADLAKGQQVYAGACFACHDTGAAGAPKKGDKAAWEPRAQQGMETLVRHSVEGFKAMPPKGGNPNLTEEDMRHAVAFMLKEAGVEAAAAETPPAAAQEPAPAEQPPAEPQAPGPAQQEAAIIEKAAAAVEKAAAAAEKAAAAAEKAAAAAAEAAAAAAKAAAAAAAVSAEQPAPPVQEEAPPQPAQETAPEPAAPATEKPPPVAPESKEEAVEEEEATPATQQQVEPPPA